MPMVRDRTPTEAFLVAFHDARPGLTAKAFGAAPVECDGRTFASSYDALADAVPMIESGHSVLDVACGDGHLLALLAARANGTLALAGVDMSVGELAAAGLRLGASAELHEAMAQDLPFADRTFDCVVCHMALMLMDDLGRVLAEIRRVLKSRASFVAVVGAPWPPSVALTAFANAISRHPRVPQLADVRLGDRRLRSREGVLEALAPDFVGIAVEDIDCSRRLTPDELWDFFLDLYDLQFLGERERGLVRSDCFTAFAALREADGKLALPQRLRRVVARVP